MGDTVQSQSVASTRGPELKLRRALVSVSDKTGLERFGRSLSAMGIEIVSTGGTARALRAVGLSVVDVSELTGYPEMMDGRVKTLHPSVHAGVLARRDKDMPVLREHGIEPFDLVCINLYPFEQTIARAHTTEDEAIEQIDIGGPALIRSAAKNHQWVTVVTAPDQYDDVVEALERGAGATSIALRRDLAARAFARVSAYDHAIASYLSRRSDDDEAAMPSALCLALPGMGELRYGENPHQRAALYGAGHPAGPSVVGATQLHGKALSYNNLNDAAAALEVVEDLSGLRMWEYAACIVKHANPCGAGVASTAAEAIRAALDGDPVAAFGGILALDGPVDVASAEILASEKNFLEVIVAESFDPKALEILQNRWANVRLLAVGEIGDIAAPSDEVHLKAIRGGVLAQSFDREPIDVSQWTHQAGPRPSEERLRDAAVIWAVTKHLTSNAVAIGAREREGQAVRLYGAGAGQMDRLTACRLAVEKAGKAPRNSIAASDGFFPFADGPEVLLQAGVTMILHPGGSKRDGETFELCDRMGVTCLTTGTRHFRH